MFENHPPVQTIGIWLVVHRQTSHGSLRLRKFTTQNVLAVTSLDHIEGPTTASSQLKLNTMNLVPCKGLDKQLPVSLVARQVSNSTGASYPLPGR